MSISSDLLFCISANDVSSRAGSLLKLSAVNQSVASVECHVTRQRPGSVGMNRHTATRMAATASMLSRSVTAVDEPAVQDKVL